MTGQGRMAEAPCPFHFFIYLPLAPRSPLFAWLPALCALLFLIFPSRLIPCPLRSINSLPPAVHSMRRLS